MAAALYLLMLPQPWVVRVDTRAMYSTAARGAAAASRWLRLRTALPNAAGLQNGWRCRHATGASVAVGRAAVWVLSMADTRWGMVCCRSDACLLASVLQLAKNRHRVIPGDLQVVPIDRSPHNKPAGAAGHQHTILVTPWQQDAVPTS